MASNLCEQDLSNILQKQSYTIENHTVLQYSMPAHNDRQFPQKIHVKNNTGYIKDLDFNPLALFLSSQSDQ